MNILFQDDYFPDEQEIWESVNAITVHGLHGKNFKKFSPIVARGTIAFDRSVKQTLKYQGWPDITWPFQNDWKVYNYDYLLNCSDLLNIDGFILGPLHGYSYITIHSFIKDYGPKWLRSNSGAKLFTGGIFTADQFQIEMDYLNETNKIDISFVMASPKIIEREWRCIIINDDVVSTSQYMNKGEVEVRSYQDTPLEVLDFANQWKLTHKFMFPNSYVLDVCEYENELKVVEVNNLLTSSFYGCDIERIVTKIVECVNNI